MPHTRIPARTAARYRRIFNDRMEKAWDKIMAEVDEALDLPPDEFQLKVMAALLHSLFPEDYREPKKLAKKASRTLKGSDRADAYAGRVERKERIYHPDDLDVKSDREAYLVKMIPNGAAIKIREIVGVGHESFA